MPEKWNEPPEPAPSWLDAGFEIKESKQDTWQLLPEKERKAEFIKLCVVALMKLGCSFEQAMEVTANSITETGWGYHFTAWNLGGVKITKPYADAYRKARNVCAKWWKAPGNKSSGDPPWCYYRAYPNAEEFFTEWLVRFTPKLGTVKENARYFSTGKHFWGDLTLFFEALCKSGYKGSITAANPQNSVNSHKQIVHRATTILGQRLLGLIPDGSIGPKTVEALQKFQAEKHLPLTATMNEGTIKALLELK